MAEETNEVQRFLEEIMARYDTGREVKKPEVGGGYVAPFQVQKMERERQRGIASSDREWKHNLMKYNLLLSQAKDREATEFLKLQLRKEFLRLGLQAEATRLDNLYRREALAEQKRHNIAQERIALAKLRASMLNVGKGVGIPPQWVVEAGHTRDGINTAKLYYDILTKSNVLNIGSKKEKTRWRNELLNILREYRKSNDRFKKGFAQELYPKIGNLHLPDGIYTKEFADKGIPTITYKEKKYELDFNIDTKTGEAVNPLIDLANVFEIDMFGSTFGESIGKKNIFKAGDQPPKKTFQQKIGSFIRSATGIGGR